LILQAGSFGNGGEIFVLDMGEPVKIDDLAKDYIKLSGLIEGEDINIVYTGLRPGEKMYEELLMAEEGLSNTVHEKIFIGKPIVINDEMLFQELDKLREIAEKEDMNELKMTLNRLVPTYTK
jgi:FlaA1/EpsC-like NDP-sugar epimerase